ncbi:MAG: hemolysin family protein [Peptococcia bacterium]
MDPDGSIQLILFLLLMLVAGLLATWECALNALNKVRLQQPENRIDPRVILVNGILEAPNQVFDALCFGKWIAGIGSVVAGTLLLYKISLSGQQTVTMFLIIIGLLALFIFLAKGVPEVLGRKYPMQICRSCCRMIMAVKYLLFPFQRLFEWPGRALGKRLGLSEKERSSNSYTEADILDLVASGQEHESMDQVEKKMLHGVFEFADMVVKDVMTPRADITALEKSTSYENLMNVVKEEQFSRIPVYDSIIDNILGVVHIKDLIFLSAEEKQDFSPEKYVRQTIFVPETKKITELFMSMKKEKIHMAIVLDEYGGTAGLVTLEDLIEEIMGDIQDEHDSEEPLVQYLDQDLIEINGGMRIEELNEYLDTDLQFEEADTVGGLVFSLLDRVPVEGDQVEIAGLEMTVWAMDGHRIEKIRISKVKTSEQSAPENGQNVPPEAQAVEPHQEEGVNGTGFAETSDSRREERPETNVAAYLPHDANNELRM